MKFFFFEIPAPKKVSCQTGGWPLHAGWGVNPTNEATLGQDNSESFRISLNHLGCSWPTVHVPPWQNGYFFTFLFLGGGRHATRHTHHVNHHQTHALQHTWIEMCMVVTGGWVGHHNVRYSLQTYHCWRWFGEGEKTISLSISINEGIKEGGLYLAKAVCLKKNTIAWQTSLGFTSFVPAAQSCSRILWWDVCKYQSPKQIQCIWHVLSFCEFHQEKNRYNAYNMYIFLWMPSAFFVSPLQAPLACLLQNR